MITTNVLEFYMSSYYFMLVKRGWTVKKESPGNDREQKVCRKDPDGESEKQRVATERSWRTM